MKNKMVAILLAVCVTFLITACDSKGEYTILEIGGYDYISAANHAEEFWGTRYDRIIESLPKKKTIEYNGIAYDMNYKYTNMSYLYNDDVEYYDNWDNGNGYEFGVIKETGKLRWYSWYDSSYLETPGLVEKSRDECFNIAKELLATLVDDPEQYELESEILLDSSVFDATYSFLFVRKIDGTKTVDEFNIRVSIYGTVLDYRAVCLGVMRGAKLPDQEKMAAIQADVDKKLDAIYEPIKDDYSVTFELDDMVFERLADGRYALEYFYKVEFISLKDENPIPRRETTRLIVILENN